ncbi:MAG: hypothetical protein J5544_03985 [Clostridia bacterium]|nr:hypothetical protein [Clostridia bacterium]
MKRILSMFIAVLMVLSIVTVPTLAEQRSYDRVRINRDDAELPNIAVTVDNDAPYAGQKFTMTASISGTFSAQTFTVSVQYDPELLEFVSIEQGPALNNVSGTPLVEHSESIHTVAGGVICFQNGTAFTSEGVVFTAKFKVKEGVEAGTVINFEPSTELTFMDFENAYTDENGHEVVPTHPVEHTETGCTVTVSETPAYIPVEITATADKTALHPGDTVKVTVSLTGTYESRMIIWTLPYDPDLFTPGTLELGAVANAATNLGFTATIAPTPSDEPNTITFTLSGPTATQALSETGVAFTAEFTVKTGAEGSYEFKPAATTFLNANYSQITDYTLEGTTVTITPAVAEPVVFEAVPSKQVVTRGEEFTVDFKISGTYEAHAINWVFPFDPELLECINEMNPAADDPQLSTNCYGPVLNAAQVVENTLAEDHIGIVIICPTVALSETGIILTAKFKVKDTAYGSYTFKTTVEQFDYAPLGAEPEEIEYSVNSENSTVEIDAPEGSVTFLVDGKTLCKYEHVDRIDELPAGAAWYGYQFSGWDMTLDDINAELEEENAVTVNAILVPMPGTITLTVINGGDEPIEKVYTESRWVTITAKEQYNGQSFQYWTLDGVVISYSIRANIRIVATCTLEAHYGDTMPEATGVAQILSASFDRDTGRLTFVAYFAAPYGAEMTDAGLIAAPGSLFDPDTAELVLGAGVPGWFEKHMNITKPNEPGCYTWIKTRVNADDVWYVRPFVCYSLNGETVTVHGDRIEVTAGTDYTPGTSGN